MKKLLLVLAGLLMVGVADVQGARRRAVIRNSSTTQTTITPTGSYSSTVDRTAIRGNVSVLDALAEVNAARARRGLRPFIHDESLALAAQSCANVRAAHHVAGHTANDFAALPRGASAAAAGCGALDPSWGWASCCTYDSYTYAGAALVYGNDGKRYMHIFVR